MVYTHTPQQKQSKNLLLMEKLSCCKCNELVAEIPEKVFLNITWIKPTYTICTTCEKETLRNEIYLVLTQQTQDFVKDRVSDIDIEHARRLRGETDL